MSATPPAIPKLINGAVNDLALITGQKPEIRKARKSIAQFKLREGMPIGARVTLRGDRMWEFLDRLISIAPPRIRDFRGLSPKQFDGTGNYAFGLNEQSMFHEIDVDSIDRPRGMDITVVTSATNRRRRPRAAAGPRLPVQGELSDGKEDRSGQQGEQEAKVRGSRVHGATSAAARTVYPQVRPVPDLPARDGAPPANCPVCRSPGKPDGRRSDQGAVGPRPGTHNRRRADHLS